MMAAASTESTGPEGLDRSSEPVGATTDEGPRGGACDADAGGELDGGGSLLATTRFLGVALRARTSALGAGAGRFWANVLPNQLTSPPPHAR
jgi:hypothetical protein